jgi:hypothetical protein
MRPGSGGAPRLELRRGAASSPMPEVPYTYTWLLAHSALTQRCVPRFRARFEAPAFSCAAGGGAAQLCRLGASHDLQLWKTRPP